MKKMLLCLSALVGMMTFVSAQALTIEGSFKGENVVLYNAPIVAHATPQVITIDQIPACTNPGGVGHGRLLLTLDPSDPEVVVSMVGPRWMFVPHTVLLKQGEAKTVRALTKGCLPFNVVLSQLDQ